MMCDWLEEHEVTGVQTILACMYILFLGNYSSHNWLKSSYTLQWPNFIYNGRPEPDIFLLTMGPADAEK